MSFKYQIGGQLEPIEELTFEGELTQGLDRIGYLNSATWGDEDSISLDLWAHKQSLALWVIVMSDGGTYCLILVEGWPTLLDALARYSPIIAMEQRHLAAEVAQAVRLGKPVPGDRLARH